MAEKSRTLKRLKSYSSFAVDWFLLRRARPYLFILVINDKCNLDCVYCSSKNSGRYDLDDIAVRKALSEAYGRGHRALVITGGEPMLWRSRDMVLKNVVSYAKEIGFLDIAVFTNGTFPLDLEGVTFIVTIDGRRDVHNAIRANTYDIILDNVRRANSKVLASMTLFKANTEDLETAVHEVTDTHLFKGITINLLTHNPDMVSRYGLLGGDRIEALDRVWRLKRQGYPIVLSKAAYSALRANNWKRPVNQIELFAGQHLFTCCRDVGNPDVCRDCGYSSCVEISQILAGRLSALLQIMLAK